MRNFLTFVIPVRHPDNSRNWADLKLKLAETINSISKQDHAGWKAVIVANHGSDLPPIPEGFEVKWVDFPPNPHADMSKAGKEAFYESVRLDKGRRILAGLLHARDDMGHVMGVDEDDFVSRKLTRFVAQHSEEPGWYLHEGFIWGDGGKLLYKYRGFSSFCGTSHIIRSDLYKLPRTLGEASETYIKQTLGSHLYIERILAEAGTPLKPLPFIGATYRIGHVGSASRSSNLLRHFFLRRGHLKKPVDLLRRSLSLRMVTHEIRAEFFGETR